MYRAITGCGTHGRCPEGDHYWVSLDGDHWLEVNRLVEDTEEERRQVEAMFNGDADGWRYVTYAKRWLQMPPQNARFL